MIVKLQIVVNFEMLVAKQQAKARWYKFYEQAVLHKIMDCFLTPNT
jgi:hypothetical protein